MATLGTRGSLFVAARALTISAMSLMSLACVSRDATSPTRCAVPSTPPLGAPADFTTAGHELAGARISARVACTGDTPGASYAIVDVGGGARRLQLLKGAIRCEDGTFRVVDGHRPVCDPKEPAAAADAPAFVDAFFRDVAAEWAKSDIAVQGIGLLSCKSDEPMIALGDYRKADRAAAILVERARAWELGGPLHLLVRGVPGACPA